MRYPRGRAEPGEEDTLEVEWSLAREVPWRSGGARGGRYPGGRPEPGEGDTLEVSFRGQF